MKGYLSRIASQSGLRIPEPRAAALAPRAADRDADPVALGIEQRIMVAPEAPEPPNAPVSRITPSPERLDSEASEKRNPVRAQESPSLAPTGPKRLAENPSLQDATDTADTARARVTFAATVPGAAVTRIVGHLAEPVVDASVFREPVPPVSVFGPPRNSDAQRSAVLGTTNPAHDAGSTAAPKQFFARTAELLTGEGAAPADSQTILLREVQEWIAATAIEPPVAHAAPAMPESTRVTRASRPPAPEATVIRERRHADEPARQQPLEQRFELSIGSIDVTIEEPERPRAPEPRPARAEKSAPAEERRHPRLSRGYL